ncbi:MAG: glycosyltransferase family 9 protein [Bacteroidetes bacterium]|nr:glycosyltransferase family 9 protein [Bacteroidota bacterium]
MSRTFIISRTDAIGDVVLTLPMAGVLRELYPDARIIFLGRSYTEDLIGACVHIDQFLNWDQLQKLPYAEGVRRMADTGADTIIHVLPRPEIARMAWKAGIKQRIGTTNRLYHWWYCNKLVGLSRKNSPYHEAQLNLRLLRPLGAQELYDIQEIGGYYGLSRLAPLPGQIEEELDRSRFNLILHPKSRGHGREWGLDYYIQLIGLLPPDRFKVFITGTSAEGAQLESLFAACPSVTDMTGRMTLSQFITFISKADGLLASGTGPLHLAAALGIHALGIFPPLRPIHPGRWAPIGPKAKALVKDIDCRACTKTMDCACIRDILPAHVKDHWFSRLSTQLDTPRPSRPDSITASTSS